MMIKNLLTLILSLYCLENSSFGVSPNQDLMDIHDDLHINTLAPDFSRGNLAHNPLSRAFRCTAFYSNLFFGHSATQIINELRNNGITPARIIELNGGDYRMSEIMNQAELISYILELHHSR